MFPVDAVIRVNVRVICNSDLGCNHNILTGHVEALQNLTKLNFSLTLSIGLSSIKMIDSIFKSSFEDLLVLSKSFFTEVDHISKRDC